MGSSNSKSKQSSVAPQKNKIQEDWETIDHMNDYNIVRKKDQQIIGELRKFKLDPIYDPKKQLDIYDMRKNLDDPLVGIHVAEKVQKISKYQKNSKSTGICGSNNLLAVVSERIPVRLQQLYQVTFPEDLYLLLTSLKGYRQLYPKVGPVHVTDRMIGLNQNGKCKVWINEDWSKNHPNDSINSLLSTRNLKLDKQYNLISPEFRDEKQMVQNIIDVVEQKCQAGKFPPDFRGMIRHNSRTFSSSIEFIQGYVRDRRIYVPAQILQDHVKTNPQEMNRIQERYRIYKQEELEHLASQDKQLHAMKQEVPQTTSEKSNNVIPITSLTWNNAHRSFQSNQALKKINTQTHQNFGQINRNRAISTNYTPQTPTYNTTGFQTNKTTNFQTNNYITPTASIYQTTSTNKPKVSFGGKAY